MYISPKKNLLLDHFVISSFLFFLGIITFFSCTNSSKYSGLSTNNPDWKTNYHFYSNQTYYEYFKQQLKQDQFSDSIDQLIQNFYSEHEPYWTNNGFQIDQINHFISIIEAAINHGLPKEMFNYSKLIELRDSVNLFKIKDKNTLFVVLTELEKTLTEQYLHYTKTLNFGATDPKMIHPGKWLYLSEYPTLEFYRSVLTNLDHFDLIIDSLIPKSKEYIELQKQIVYFSNISDTLKLDTLNHTKEYFLEKVIANLERLRWKTNRSASNSYIAINIPDFMLRAFINDTCVVALKICCGQTYLKNQLEKLEYINGVYPSGKWETPLLKSNISTLVLNPEWNIPYSILKDEYFPKLQKDHLQIISKEKLMVYNSRRERVDPNSINWNNYSKNNIPFTLVQSSGTHNALGKIKFDFSNSESVYVHDTPNKSAFKRKNRAISHGCCRLENPLDLAQIMLKYNQLTDEEIEKVFIIMGIVPQSELGQQYMDSIKLAEDHYFSKLSDQEKKWYRPLRPVRFNLKKSIPLYIEYYTCFLNEKDSVQYCEDVYHKDKGILYQLKNYK
jgi:L,D-transpeptidase YcbB